MTVPTSEMSPTQTMSPYNRNRATITAFPTHIKHGPQLNQPMASEVPRLSPPLSGTDTAQLPPLGSLTWQTVYYDHENRLPWNACWGSPILETHGISRDKCGVCTYGFTYISEDRITFSHFPNLNYEWCGCEIFTILCIYIPNVYICDVLRGFLMLECKDQGPTY